MNYSTHYNFNEPELTDAPDIRKVSDAIEAIDGVLYEKVDKETGKGLSSNDYTDTDKTAVGTIGDKVDKETGKGLSTNDYTTAEKNKVATIPSITTPTISISTSTGVLDSYTIRKFGNVVFLKLTVYNNSSVASSGNIFTGAINTTALRPVDVATGGGYWGGHAVGILIGAGGSITVRNASSSAFTPNSSNKINISVMYMVE